MSDKSQLDQILTANFESVTIDAPPDVRTELANDLGVTDKPLYELNAAEYGYLPHEWTFGSQIRTCGACGKREAYWDDQEYPIDPCLGRNVQVRIENAYSDGHESTREVWLAAPDDLEDLEDWWQDVVFDETGDGHGADNPKLGSYYRATIMTAASLFAVGLSCEWSD